MRFHIRGGAWLACGASILFAGAPVHAAPTPQSCNASIVSDPYPGRVTFNVPIGYGGGGYNVTDLVTPELIPMGIEAEDNDEVLAICDLICGIVPSSSDYDVDWTASDGDFVDENANMSPSMAGFWHVLYLPPRDLAVGDTKVIKIEARVYDLCDLAGDPDSLITIEVQVDRKTDRPNHPGVKRFDVKARVVSIADPIVPPPICGDSSDQICELLGPWVQTFPGPTGGITRVPPGIVVGETRPLDCDVSDMDTAMMECGTPVGYYPVVSNFAQELFCDCFISYQWTVIAGPGNGVFTRQGRSALFRATVPGMVTIQLIARTPDNETVTDTRTFEIHAAKMKAVEYDDNETIARDKDGADYTGYDWYDHDGDGLAITPDPTATPGLGANLTGDRRFPLAYVRGTAAAEKRLKIKKVAFDCKVKPMPGAVIRGNIPGLPPEQFIGGWQLDTPATWLFAKDLTGKQLIPDWVGWFPTLQTDWEVSWGNQNWVQPGSSENTYYIVLATPQFPTGAYYKPYETLFDVACRMQPGGTGNQAVTDGVWAAMSQKFGAESVPRTKRKIVDGHLKIDQTTMGYWRTPAAGTCLSVGQMLGNPTGEGQCSAWAQLLRGSLLVHGLPSMVYFIKHPSRDLMVNNWREVVPQAAGNPWTIPTHVSPNLAAGGPVRGIPGQDNPVPPKFFKNHYITRIGTTFYDPSYGNQGWATEALYEDAAFWGFSNVARTMGWKNVVNFKEANFTASPGL